MRKTPISDPVYPKLDELRSGFNYNCIGCEECLYKSKFEDEKSGHCIITQKQVDDIVSYLKSKDVLKMIGPDQIAFAY